VHVAEFTLFDGP